MAADQPKSGSMERLQQLLPTAYDKYQLLVHALEQMVANRIETLSQLNRIADELDKRHRTGNIVKVVGTATGTAGTAVAAAGAALTPVSLGFGLAFVVGGAVVAGLGTVTAFGAQVTEKVCEKVDLEKIQEAVDKDKTQCQQVLELWKEFENYCVDTINTIALADPLEESDIESLQTWIQVGMEVVTSPVILVAEAFESIFSKSKTASVPGKELCGALVVVASALAAVGRDMILRSVVSWITKCIVEAPGIILFMGISVVLVGNVFVLIMTLIDMHRGSTSKVAKELRQKFSELQEELDKWLDAFEKSRST